YAAELEADTIYELGFDNDDLGIEVVDPDGIPVDLAEDDDPETNTSTFTTGSAGTYRIRVDGGFDRTAGDYGVALDETVPFVLGDGTTPTAEGVIEGPDGEQYIDIEVRGGSVVYVDVTTTDPAFDMVVILRDPADDSEIDRYDSGGPGEAESVEFTPEDDTSWRIAVQGLGGSTGSFTVEAYED
ncbi:MAG TPA: hypothetical protein VK507_11615, partial [Iamia sp.]|nr:hypothetical protein [Iamia sp.]